MIAVLGFLAAALSISVVWPQVWLSCRHGRTLGLSPTSSWLGVALNLCWLSFGLLTGDVAQVLTHAVVGAGNTAVLAALLLSQPHLRSRRVLLRTATGAAGLAVLAFGSIAAAAFLGADPAAVAVAMGAVIGLVGAAAAVLHPLRLVLNPSLDLSGLSSARWRMGAGSSASWATYGVLIDQPTVWLSSGFGLGCALVMCVMLHARSAARTGMVGQMRPALTVVSGRLTAASVGLGAARPVLAA